MIYEFILIKNNHYDWIFIDTPEFGIHLKVQEFFIRDLLHYIRPKNVIIATHSPEIIGMYSANVLHMSEISEKK